MQDRKPIQTHAAPQAIGPYSQGVRVGDTLYLSGQIALHPDTMELVGDGDAAEEARRVFANLAAVAKAGGASLARAVRITLYLCDMADFPAVNRIMEEFCSPPYPTRACVQVSALPRNARVEADAVLVL